ncbi:dTMP kinase [Streptomyces sp. WM6378]|uniref:dTMP kinase n=1 Tax=Streptomyces sp. WM6378 TaxID=1415557 RepID=UPI000A831C9E|nr:AAA family ATPase [Streptomyces sp. WM6378]
MSLPPAYAPIPYDDFPRGFFGVLEGVSGVGKSTLARVLAKRLGATALHTLTLPHQGWAEEARLRLRALPQFGFYLSGLLHTSDRARQELTAGPVIADRYRSSVIACHAAAHGVAAEDVTRLLDPFDDYLAAPDRTFYLRCSEEALRERMRSKQDLKQDDTDLFEVPHRLKQLLANFETVAAGDPTAVVLDTDGRTPDQLADEILTYVEGGRA